MRGTRRRADGRKLPMRQGREARLGTENRCMQNVQRPRLGGRFVVRDIFQFTLLGRKLRVRGSRLVLAPGAAVRALRRVVELPAGSRISRVDSHVSVPHAPGASAAGRDTRARSDSSDEARVCTANILDARLLGRGTGRFLPCGCHGLGDGRNRGRRGRRMQGD